jgi:hypothetical protein
MPKKYHTILLCIIVAFFTSAPWPETGGEYGVEYAEPGPVYESCYQETTEKFPGMNQDTIETLCYKIEGEYEERQRSITFLEVFVRTIGLFLFGTLFLAFTTTSELQRIADAGKHYELMELLRKEREK